LTAEDRVEAWNVHDTLGTVHAATSHSQIAQAKLDYYMNSRHNLTATAAEALLKDALQHIAYSIQGARMAARYLTLHDSTPTTIFDLSELVEEQVELLRPSFENELIYLKEASPVVRGQRDNLGRVFSNLLRNAAKAMQGRSGPIEVLQDIVDGYESSGCLPDEQASQGLYAHVMVQDGGEGLPGEVLEQLRTGRYQDPKRGARSGLEYCIHVLGAHKGQLCIDSDHQQGTVIHAYLPLAAQK
jgi:signal transduction histidine kinase